MRWLKYVFVGFAALIALLVIAAVIFFFTFDEEDFKARVEQTVLDSTGRELAIDGPLDVSLFPWIAVNLSDVRLGNAAGFSDNPFAEISQASLGVKMMPLLSRQIEIGDVSIDGLHLNLETRADGVSNWDDLAGQETADASAETDASDSDGGFATSGVASLNISNANLTYSDAVTPANYEVKDFNVNTGSLTPGEPVAMSMSANFSDGENNGAVTFDGTVAADDAFENIDISDVSLELVVTGFNADGSDLDAVVRSDRLMIDLAAQHFDGGDMQVELGDARLATQLTAESFIDAPKITGTVSLAPVAINRLMASLGQEPVELPDPDADGQLQAEFSFDTDLSRLRLSNLSASVDDYTMSTSKLSLGLDDQSLAADTVSIAAGDIKIDATVTGQNVIDAPKLTGKLTLHPVSVAKLLDLAGQPAIETTDPTVLQRFAVKSEYQTDLNSLLLKKLELTLDDSTIAGRFEIKDFETAVTRFNLRIDTLNIDRYLPPADESEASGESASDASDDSLDALSGLDVKGNIKIREAQAMGLKFANLSFGLLAKNGHIQVHPSEAKMYGGKYSGHVRLNSNPKPAIASVDENVTGVDIAALTTDLVEGGIPVSGTAAAKLQVELPYGVDGALTQKASGLINLSVTDGIYTGVDLWHTLKSGVARVRQEQVPPDPENPQTAFSEFVAKGPIENGRWNTEELRVRLDYGTVTGTGYVDLTTEALDYHLDVVIDDTPEIRQDPQLKKLVRASIPIRVTGTIESPRALPDVGELLKRQAEQAAKEKIDEQTDKLKEKLEEKLKGIFDN